MSDHFIQDEDEDSRDSPQCLMTSEPNRDPYSTDERNRSMKLSQIEKERKLTSPKKKKKRSIKENPNLSKTDLTPKQIVDSFHINFLSTEKHPTRKELFEFDINGVLTSLLSFISVDGITSKDAVEAVLNIKPYSPQLKWLYYYKKYKFPNSYDGADVNEFEFVQHQVDYLLKKVQNVEETISEANYEDVYKDITSFEHDSMKFLFHHFLSLTSEIQRGYGECLLHIQIPRLSASGQYVGCDRMNVKPDILFGEDYSFPCIPIKVYHGCCIANSEEREGTDKEDNEWPLKNQGSRFSSSKDLAVLEKFITENLPESLNPQEYLIQFKKELMQELLIQVLASANEYITSTAIYQGFDREKHTYLGIFVIHFNLYIMKLQGRFEDIHNACLNLSWHDANRGKYPLDISLYPVPLDIRNPSHGIAILFFMKYYRNLYKHC